MYPASLLRTLILSPLCTTLLSMFKVPELPKDTSPPPTSPVPAFSIKLELVN